MAASWRPRLAASPSPQQVELLQDGFDRLAGSGQRPRAVCSSDWSAPRPHLPACGGGAALYQLGLHRGTFGQTLLPPDHHLLRRFHPVLDSTNPGVGRRARPGGGWLFHWPPPRRSWSPAAENRVLRELPPHQDARRGQTGFDKHARLQLAPRVGTCAFTVMVRPGSCTIGSTKSTFPLNSRPGSEATRKLTCWPSFN